MELLLENNISILTSRIPFNVASFAICNGGIKKDIIAVFNKTLSEKYWHHTEKEINDDVQRDLSEYKIDIKNSVGLFTAVPQKYFGVYKSIHQNTGLEVNCFATAGIGNGSLCHPFDSSVYDEETTNQRPNFHTINVIVWINRSLTDGAMLESLNQIAHAKMMVLIEKGLISDKSGKQALCTGTDCSAICSLKESKYRFKWAGPLTIYGGMVAETAYYSIKSALKHKEDFDRKNKNL